MSITDEQIADKWREYRNYAQVGRELGGVHRTTVRMRVLKMRAEGVDLPPPQRAGYTLTSERASLLRHEQLRGGPKDAGA